MSQDLPRLFGNYSLLKLLARGGMGEIYLARTAGITGFEKYYAVKKLLKKFTHDNDVGARFIDEAKLGARLQHPNIVQVYDLGRVQDELYMATEFVDGFDLRRVLRFCHEKKKRIPLDIALFIVREILSGLAYAHRQVDAEGHSINLIHRDISPQNVLVSFEGEVKIIDFGLAKSTQRSQETQANVLLGNFGYMSPEQARGHPLDVRTDVYSAGIVLFELVTGTKRFVEENPLRLLEMVARPTPIVPSDRVPTMPRAIDNIYLKASAPNRDERHESAEAFRDEVTTALHKINPKASRENLAQFLNHLFLGGQAPAPVDADILDKSVAIRVRDLHEASDAFRRPASADLHDRRLQEFSEDAPQTASHALMRQARAGDVLTHQELTGEDLSSAPTLMQIPVAAERDAAPLAPPPALLDLAVGLDPGPAAGVTAPHARAGAALPGALADADEAIVVDLEPLPSTGVPTSIYDSPSWPGELDRAAAAADPLTLVNPIAPGDSSLTLSALPTEGAGDINELLEMPELDLEVQLDTEQQQREAEAAVQRQIEAQFAAAMGSPAGPAAAPPASLDLGETAPMPAAPRSSVGRATNVHPAPPLPSPRASTGSAAAVTTVGPPPKKSLTAPEQPSIVVEMDLDPSEPTMVGALPTAPAATYIEQRDQGAGGFGEGGAHESLIIDFDAAAEHAPVAPEDPSSDKNIRPAARPLGRPAIVPTTRKRPAEKAGAPTPPPSSRRR